MTLDPRSRTWGVALASRPLKNVQVRSHFLSLVRGGTRHAERWPPLPAPRVDLPLGLVRPRVLVAARRSTNTKVRRSTNAMRGNTKSTRSTRRNIRRLRKGPDPDPGRLKDGALVLALAPVLANRSSDTDVLSQMRSSGPETALGEGDLARVPLPLALLPSIRPGS